MIGIIGMLPSLAMAGCCFYFREQLGGSLIYLSVFSIVCFVIFINISLSPLGWLLISEIFPLPVRGVGIKATARPQVVCGKCPPVYAGSITFAKT